MSNSLTVLPALHTTGTFPELAIHNHSLRMDAVIDVLSSNGTRSLIDLGCGDGAFIKKIIGSNLQLDEYIGIDNWQDRLDSAQAVNKLDKDWLSFREGSMTDLESAIDNPANFRHLGAVVLLETIEHVPLEDVTLIEAGVFGHVSPDVVVVTTPDATKRLNDDQLQARGHYFEWDIPEFHDWAESITSQYPSYSVDLHQLTGPTFVRNTQIAVFDKTSSNI